MEYSVSAFASWNTNICDREIWHSQFVWVQFEVPPIFFIVDKSTILGFTPILFYITCMNWTYGQLYLTVVITTLSFALVIFEQYLPTCQIWQDTFSVAIQTNTFTNQAERQINALMTLAYFTVNEDAKWDKTVILYMLIYKPQIFYPDTYGMFNNSLAQLLIMKHFKIPLHTSQRFHLIWDKSMTTGIVKWPPSDPPKFKWSSFLMMKTYFQLRISKIYQVIMKMTHEVPVLQEICICK